MDRSILRQILRAIYTQGLHKITLKELLWLNARFRINLNTIAS